MVYAVGVDVGSTQTKAIVLDGHRRIVGRALLDTGANVIRAGERAFEAALEGAGIGAKDVACVVGTGYGRYRVTLGDVQITEISCHAKGAHFLFPSTRTVIDMGGQDAKGIKLAPGGDVEEFVMNDKCAAGTGRFLVNAAEVLGLPLEEIGEVSLRATSLVRLSTVCTVFVESDIMSYLARGKRVEDILGGVHHGIASRTIALVRRVGIEEEVTFTGGVARNVGVVAALETQLGTKLNISPESHYMGALGAALWALERAQARGETVPA